MPSAALPQVCVAPPSPATNTPPGSSPGLTLPMSAPGRAARAAPLPPRWPGWRRAPRTAPPRPPVCSMPAV
eukprot:355508-Chlamydomonas_euryale.AAC.3